MMQTTRRMVFRSDATDAGWTIHCGDDHLGYNPPGVFATMEAAEAEATRLNLLHDGSESHIVWRFKRPAASAAPVRNFNDWLRATLWLKQPPRHVEAAVAREMVVPSALSTVLAD